MILLQENPDVKWKHPNYQSVEKPSLAILFKEDLGEYKAFQETHPPLGIQFCEHKLFVWNFYEQYEGENRSKDAQLQVDKHIELIKDTQVYQIIIGGNFKLNNTIEVGGTLK